MDKAVNIIIDAATDRAMREIEGATKEKVILEEIRRMDPPAEALEKMVSQVLFDSVRNHLIEAAIANLKKMLPGYVSPRKARRVKKSDPFDPSKDHIVTQGPAPGPIVKLSAPEGDWVKRTGGEGGLEEFNESINFAVAEGKRRRETRDAPKGPSNLDFHQVNPELAPFTEIDPTSEGDK